MNYICTVAKSTDYGQQTADGGYIACGSSLIKTDNNGNKLWEKTYSGQSVQQTADGGYIICGQLDTKDSFTRPLLLLKTDSNGNKLWDKTFGEAMDECQGISVRQTSDRGYIICGSIRSSRSGDDAWLIKTDADGNKLWDKTFGDKGSKSDYFFSVQQTSDGGYIVCGDTSSYGAGKYDIWLLKLSMQPK